MTPPVPSSPGPARRWWRRLYWLRRDAPVLPVLLRPGPLLYAGRGGIGDELLTTALAESIHRQRRAPVTIFARYPDLFAHHPAVRRTLPADERVLAAAERWGRPLHRPFGWQRDIDADRHAPPRDHILAEKARAAGLTGEHVLRPRLHLRPDELDRARADVGPSVLTIQSAGIAARWHMANKEWGPERFQALLPLLPPGLRVVQLGTLADPPLAGALDRRGVSRRESAALIAVSATFVGLAGFLMHLARAVDRRSVIVFGGREHPSQTGYPCNENLHTTPPCSPCWQRNLCDHDRACLSAITPAHAADAVRRVLAADLRAPLTEERFRL